MNAFQWANVLNFIFSIYFITTSEKKNYKKRKTKPLNKYKINLRIIFTIYLIIFVK